MSGFRKPCLAERWFRRFGDGSVAFPAFVFESDGFDGDAGLIGVEIEDSGEFGDPAAEDEVGEDELTGFVVDLDGDVLAEILE
jgi:hypothetical protein